MAAIKELKYLKSEENLLVDMIAKLEDCRNRLRVEELNIRGAIQNKKIQHDSEISEKKKIEVSVVKEDDNALSDQENETLCLEVQKTLEDLAAGYGCELQLEVEEEEEEEEEDEQ